MRQSQERSAERGERLAQRFISSVLPVFVIDERWHPERRGSCVLVQIEECRFALTARHVLNEGDLQLHAAAAPRGRLTALPYHHAFGTAATDLDIGVLPLRRSGLAAFKTSVFLDADDINENHEVKQGLAGNSHFVIGYSASRSQVRVSHVERHIHQVSFQFTGLGEPPGTYTRESLDPAAHLIVEFDRKKLRFKGQSVIGPKVQGVSGGAIFHLTDGSVAPTAELVAIATEHRKQSRLIVGTRIEHFMRLARELMVSEPALFA